MTKLLLMHDIQLRAVLSSEVGYRPCSGYFPGQHVFVQLPIYIMKPATLKFNENTGRV
jgi:hypothetical protein